MADVPALPDFADLPQLPDDLAVTPWQLPSLPQITPREAVALLLNESYLRCRLYGERLDEQQRTERARAGQPGGGLVGYKTGRAPDGTMYPTGEEERSLVRIEREERRFCAVLAKQAHDLGITGDDWR